MNGSLEVRGAQDIVVPFSNGKFEVTDSRSGRLEYRCEVVGQAKDPVQNEKSVRFAFEKTVGVKCDLEIPKGKKLILIGANGKVDMDRLTSPLRVELTNGKVSISPEERARYQYDLHVGNGKLEAFESSKDKDATLISVDVKNGSIGRG